MKLSIFERITLLNIFDSFRGDILSVRIIDTFMKEIDFTNDDYEKLGIHIGENGKVFWKKENEYEIDVDVKPRVCVIIEDELKKLSNRKLLAKEHLSLYEKFVENN